MFKPERLMRALVLLALAGLFDVSQMSVANAGPRFSILGAGNFMAPTTTDIADTYTPKLGLGGALLAEFPLSSKVSLELGGIYLTRNCDDTDGATTLTFKTTSIEVPVGLRIFLGRTVSFGFGGFAATAASDEVTVTDVTGTATKYSYGSAFPGAPGYGLKKLDYGVYASLGVAVPLGSSFAFTIDGRYQLGLSNVLIIPTGGVGTMKYTDMIGLVGFRLGGKVR